MRISLGRYPMDVFTVSSKSTEKTSAASRTANGGSLASELAGTFNNLLRDAGTRMGANATSLIPQASRTGASRETEPTARPREDHAERREQPAVRDAKSPHRTRSERGDERRSTEAEPTSTAPVKDRQASEKSTDTDTSGANRAETPSAAKKASDDNTKADDGATGTTQTAESQEQPAKANAGAGDKAAADASASAPVTAAVVAETPIDDQMIVASLLVPQILAQSTATATGTAKVAADTPKAVDPLSGSTNAVGQGVKGDVVAPDTTAQTVIKGSQTAGQKASDLPSQNQTAQDGAANPAANPADIKTQQAAELSKMSGAGNPIVVRSTVTNPAAQLVSQPSSTLSASSVAATDGTTPAATTATAQTGPLHSQQANPGLANGAVNPLAAQNDPINAQAGRSQTAALTGDAGTTVIQGAGSSNATGMQTSSGGNENLAGGSAQTLPQSPAAQQASAAQATSQPRFTVPQQAVTDQISVQITKAIKDGVDRINIQLRPEHMGRVDVRLEVNADGRVQATVTADNKGTLEMLQRDSRELERALQQAGLQTDTGSLNFSLREQSGQGHESGRQPAGGYAVSGAATAAADGITEQPAWTNYPDGIRPDGRIDIRA